MTLTFSITTIYNDIVYKVEIIIKNSNKQKCISY